MKAGGSQSSAQKTLQRKGQSMEKAYEGASKIGRGWGNYLIIEVDGIPLHIREHSKAFWMLYQLIYNQ